MDNESYFLSITESLAGLSVFYGLRQHPLMNAFINAVSLKTDDGNYAPLKTWACFTAAFAKYSDDTSFGRLIYRLALADVNDFTLAVECGCLDENSFISKIAANDITALSYVAAFDFKRFMSFFAEILCKNGTYNGALARIEEEVDFLASLCRYDPPWKDLWNINEFISFIRKNGAGDLACSNFFYISNGKLQPAVNSDPVQLRDLSGYEDERQVVVSNTLRFLSVNTACTPAANLTAANNILLYGDRGCGKSATVKAICNEYAGQGLRLVELRKTELASLPAIMHILGWRGLRFILFIDDLSFETGDSDFMMLKAMLEGGIETKPSNVVIYATSNRRHFVKESNSDRPSSQNDVRAFDTMQEQLSLADRFGLTVIFSAPSQDEYLNIAVFIAQKYGILPKDPDAEQLKHFKENALRWERWFNGRSPRTAAQFVEWIAAGEDFPWDEYRKS